jgi:hypothetical protein
LNRALRSANIAGAALPVRVGKFPENIMVIYA